MIKVKLKCKNLMSRPFSFSEGEYYHVFNRGVEKRLVFTSPNDKSRFQKLLYLCNGTEAVHLSTVREIFSGIPVYQINRGKPITAIGAYCLMGSHFHLLIRELVDGGISQFMQKLMTAYTMYFNIRNERSGSLFEGRFRARHAHSDEYLKYLYSYIHLNPVEHIEPAWRNKGIKNMPRVKKYLKDYRHSSFPDYLKVTRPEFAILMPTKFPSYFKKQTDFMGEMTDWLEFQPEQPPPY